MSQPSDIVAFNNKFLDSLDSIQGREKTASGLGTYTRDRLREESAYDKIQPPKDISPRDCQISLNHDTLVRIEFMEPDSRALAMTYRGFPRAQFIRAPKYAIPFYMIASPMIEKTEEELMAYRDVPLTKIIEDNIIKDMQEIKDRTAQLHFETAVQGMQYDAHGNTYRAMRASTYLTDTLLRKVSVIKGRNAVAAGVDNFVVRPILKPDIVELRKLMSQYVVQSRRMELDRILMSKPDFEDVQNWTLQDMGDRVTGSTVEDGWKHPTLVGVKYIVTNKTDIFKPGNVWGFAKPEFLGHNYILQRAKFYVDKIMNLIKWASWMHVGHGIGNIAGVVKLELYGGSVVPTATDTGFQATLPVGIDDLGKKNNRVDEGLTAGTVSLY